MGCLSAPTQFYSHMQSFLLEGGSSLLRHCCSLHLLSRAVLAIFLGYRNAFLPSPALKLGAFCASLGLGNDSVSVGAWYDVNVSSG